MRSRSAARFHRQGLLSPECELFEQAGRAAVLPLAEIFGTNRTRFPNPDRSSDRGTSLRNPCIVSGASLMSSSRKYASATQMAARQRTISVAEFFAKNRHLLGFDSPYRAVLTTVKEAVDNALDACEEAGILPEVSLEITELDNGSVSVIVQDNGPGIVEAQVGRIFGKLLYGSRFHRLSQSRGQQGIGIAAACLYSQLTTGKPMHIRTRVRRGTAWDMFVSIDTARNKPEVRKKHEVEWQVAHGTRIETEMEGQYRVGAHSVLRYLRLTALANPHVTLKLTAPDGGVSEFRRSLRNVPPVPEEIEPHPHGVELGRLILMLKHTQYKSLGSFLQNEFSRVGGVTAKRIIARAGRGLTSRSNPRRVARKQAGRLHRAIIDTKISAPATSCVVPIGEERIVASLRREVTAALYHAVSRTPTVYNGNPFCVEVGLAYGRADAMTPERSDAAAATEDTIRLNDAEPVTLLRFANRVPLLFQQSACVMTRAVVDTHWKSYGLTQSKGALPLGPLVIFLHVASVWVPFTSESKEAVADYDELRRELSLALRECGRHLRAHIAKHARLAEEEKRRSHIETFLPHIAAALTQILGLDPGQNQQIVSSLDEALIRARSASRR